MSFELPFEYIENMKTLLGEEYDAYEKSLQKPLLQGLRVNTGKISVEDFLKICPFKLEKIPWIENGFYYEENQGISKHPYYFAGLYYLQEPSAMTPASRLCVDKEDWVLDLCAAPGGKATQLGSQIGKQGMLVANDISNSRAKALLKNLELHGIRNMLVTSDDPKKLADVFENRFDKILIDAPCSGEGMFHKEPGMASFWTEHGPEYYSPIQRILLEQAYQMLKPGGRMLFSTCTFSDLEDEGSISYILSQHEDLHLEEPVPYEKFSHGIKKNPGDEELEKCVRIWPHKMDGEGHFLALMKKEDQNPTDSAESVAKKRIEAKYVSQDKVFSKDKMFSKDKRISFDKLPKEVQQFLGNVKMDFITGSFFMQQERVYYLADGMQIFGGIRYLRTGFYLGDVKKNRFEPSQALAMGLQMEEYDSVINLQATDIRTVKYLKGETISVDMNEKKRDGYQLVCVDGYPLGWGKSAGNSLKNKYYPGWRLQ